MLLQQTADFASAVLFTQRQAEADAKRRQGYKRNWEYYSGDHKKPLKVRQGQPNDNVIINLARLVVDKGASFLFGKEVEFQLEEGEQTPNEDYLKEVWQRNNKQTFLTKVSTSGGIYGHVFVKLDPDALAPGIPRLTNIAPENMSVSWLPDDPETAWRYVITWIAEDKNGQSIMFRQRIVADEEGMGWNIFNERTRPGGNWESDPDRPDPEWPFAWPPISHNQNISLPNCFYGASDLEDLSEQDALNFTASHINRILRYHAHPRTIGSGFGNSDIEVGADDILVLPSVESKLWNLEMQSELGPSLTFMDRLIQLFMQQSRTPQIDPNEVNIGALSGFAMKILQGPLLEKTNTKRNTYGDMLIELNRRLLELAGKGDDHRTILHWPDPLPTDEAAERERDQFELDNKIVGRETVQKRRGIDPEVEAERIAADSDADGNVGAALLRDFMNGRGTEEGVP